MRGKTMRDGTATRKKLERCALTLFVKQGFSETTIRDIAEKAGVAEGTLYRHYVSKDELAQHLFFENYQEIADQFQKIAKEHDNFSEKMKAMVVFFCEQYDKDPTLFNYLLITQHHQLKKLSEKQSNAHKLLLELFIDAIAQNQVQGLSADFCASLVLGIILQAAISRVYGRIKRTMMADANELAAAILRALKVK
jgi:AcrR family transcriptional regulator